MNDSIELCEAFVIIGVHEQTLSKSINLLEGI